jgi:hypothetical protein
MIDGAEFGARIKPFERDSVGIGQGRRALSSSGF